MIQPNQKQPRKRQRREEKKANIERRRRVKEERRSIENRASQRRQGESKKRGEREGESEDNKIVDFKLTSMNSELYMQKLIVTRCYNFLHIPTQMKLVFSGLSRKIAICGFLHLVKL